MDGKIGGYRILEEVGQDAFGESFLASGADGRSLVWLTLTGVRPRNVRGQTLLDDLRALGNVRVDCFQSILDSGVNADGRVYFVCPFWNGSTLLALLEKAPQIPVFVASGIILRLVEAVLAGEREGRVHGNLSPEMVLLSEDGGFLVRGMGLQTVLEDDGEMGGDIALSGEADAQDYGDLVGLIERIADSAAPPLGRFAAIAGEWLEDSNRGLEKLYARLQSETFALEGFSEDAYLDGLNSLSFFFLLNRKFTAQDVPQDEAPVQERKDPAKEAIGPKSTGSSPGFADDLGGVFLALDSSEIESGGLEEDPGACKPFNALEMLERQEQESEERKARWVRKGVIGFGGVVATLILAAVIQTWFGEDLDARARQEMIQEFPRFESDFAAQSVRIAPGVREDETVGGTVAPDWFREAMDVWEKGDVKGVREVLRRAAELHPGDWRRHVAYANSLLPDRWDEAVGMLRSFRARVPKQPEVDVTLAGILAEFGGQNGEAIALMQEVLGPLRQEPAYFVQLAKMQAGQGEPGEAVVSLRELRKFPALDSGRVNLALARMHETSGDPFRAHKVYKELLSRKEEFLFESAYWGWVRTGFALDDVRALVEVSRGLLRDLPESRPVLLFLTEYSLARRMLDEAEGLLKRLEESEITWETEMLRGILDFRRKDFQSALAFFTRALQKRPKDGRIRFNLGMTYRGMEEDMLAFEAFRRAMEDEPDLWIPHCVMGQDYVSTKNWEKAAEMFRAAASRIAKHPWLHDMTRLAAGSSRVSDLAGKPCLHTGIVESLDYARAPGEVSWAPVVFEAAVMNAFRPAVANTGN